MSVKENFLSYVTMMKVVIGIVMCCLILSNRASVTSCAEEITGDEIIDSMLKDEELLSSNNFMVQELLNEILDGNSNINQFIEGQSQIGNPDLPQWMTGLDDDKPGHANMIGYIMSEFSNESSNKKEIIKRCLLYGSYKADTANMHNSSQNIVQLHAIRNYVANLKALWKYSKLIYSHTDTYCYNNIINTMPNLTSQEQQDLSILLNTVPNIYAHFQNKFNHAPSKLEQKYLVMGLALHLIGDIYAHRTIVPSYYGDSDLADSYWNENHFSNYDELLSAASAGTLLCTKIDEYMRNDLPNSLNSYYEDNIDFIPNRYIYSKRTCKKFVHEILISGNNFS